MGVIKSQGIKNSVLTYIGIALGLLNILVIQPRLLSTTEIGLTRVLFSFSAIVAMFVPLGIGSMTLRYFPHFNNPEKKHYGHFGLYLLFTSVGFLLITLLLILFKDFFTEHFNKNSSLFSDYYLWVIPLSLFIATTAIFTLYTSSIYKTSFSVLLNEVFNRLANILIIVGYYYKAYSFDTFIALFVLIQLVQSVSLIIYIIKVDNISINIDWLFIKKFNMKEVFSYGFLMLFTAFASLGVKLIDQAIMGMLLPLSMVGIYSIGVFITAVMEAPINSLEKIASAKIAAAWVDKNHQELDKIYRESTKYLFLFGGLLFVGLNVCITYIFEFLPSEYAAAIPVARIMSFASLINLATGVNSSILAYSNKYIYYSFLLFVLITLTVVNNFWLIPIYGIIGAAYASCVSLLIFNVLKFFVIWNRFGMQPFDFSTIKISGSIVLAFIPYFLLPDLGNVLLNLFVFGGTTGIIYMACVYVFNIVPEFYHLVPFLKNK